MKHDISVKQEQFNKLDQQTEHNISEVKGMNQDNMDGEIRRRNSADDAGWVMASATYGGNKTKRNRKGNRAPYNTNDIQSPDHRRGSSASIKSKGKYIYYYL